MGCLLFVRAAWIEIQLFFKYKRLKIAKYFKHKRLRKHASRGKKIGQIVHATYEAEDKHLDITAYIDDYMRGADEPNCYHLRMFLGEFIALAPNYKIHVFYHYNNVIKYVCIDLENGVEITSYGILNEGVIDIYKNSTRDNQIS